MVLCIFSDWHRILFQKQIYYLRFATAVLFSLVFAHYPYVIFIYDNFKWCHCESEIHKFSGVSTSWVDLKLSMHSGNIQKQKNPKIDTKISVLRTSSFIRHAQTTLPGF